MEVVIGNPKMSWKTHLDFPAHFLLLLEKDISREKRPKSVNAPKDAAANGKKDEDELELEKQHQQDVDEKE